MIHILKKFSVQTFSSFRFRNYRLYAIGQFISQCGTWMQTVVLGWLVIELTGSGTQLGTVVALQYLPMLLLGPLGGVLVDRSDKRTVLYITHTIFGLLAFAMSVLVFTSLVKLWMLYVFSLALGIVRILDNPARQTFASDIVPINQLKNAVSLNSTSNNLARSVGPSVGGIFIASVGIASCFFFNAFSYLFAIATLFLIRKEELLTVEKSAKKTGQLQEGFRYVMATPLIRQTLLMVAIIGTFSYEWQVSLPLMADKVFHGGATSYATFLSAMGIGSVIGGLYAASRHKIAQSHLIFFALFFGTSMLITAVMPSFFLATIGMFVIGFFSINFTALATTLLQIESEPAMRGRVMALWGVAFIGSTTIGGPVIGFIGEQVGGRSGLGFGGLVALGTALFLAVSMRRKDIETVIPESVEITSESAIGKG